MPKSKKHPLFQIGSGFGLIILLIAMVCAISLYGVHKLAQLTDLSYQHPLTVSNALREINSNILKIQIQIDEISRHRHETDISVNLAGLDSSEREIERLFEVVELRYLGPIENVSSARTAFDAWKTTYRNAINKVIQGEKIEYDGLYRLHDSTNMEPIIAPLAEMRDFAGNKANFLLAESQATVKQVRRGILLFFSILMGLTALIGYVVISRVRSDIDKISAIEKNLYQTHKLDSIGRLAGGVAHDFNNMLMPIIAYSDLMLQDTSINDERREMLEQIKLAGEHAAELTKQLLAFSRKQILEVKVLNLNDIIMETERMFRRLISENIELTTILHPELNRIKSDRAQMEQILMNLVVNAKDAAPEGGKILIETSNVYLAEEYASKHEGVLPGQYVLMAISDTGKGMNQETIDHIFEPFFTTKEKGKGTGLGLATIYGIVKQHGGHIKVYSELNHGSTFKVYLPAIDEPASADYSISREEQTIRKGNGETVLLAEDDKIVRKMVAKILKHNGYNVVTCPSLATAVRLVRQEDILPDLLVTDVVMPEMSGKQLYENLLEIKPGLKVVYMSGYTDNVITHHGILDAGINFIQKPFTEAALIEKIHLAMND